MNKENIKKFKLIIIVLIVTAIVISGIVIIPLIKSRIEFNKKHAILINQPNGNIEITEEVEKLFLENKILANMVRNLNYNNEVNETRNILFVDCLLDYLVDANKVEKINGEDYNMPIIENGMINYTMSKQEFLKYFKYTYDIDLSKIDFEKDEDFMGAIYFYKVNKKLCFSLQPEYDEFDKFSLLKVNKLEKLNKTYTMDVIYYGCDDEKTYQSLLQSINNNKDIINEKEIITRNKQIVFDLNVKNDIFSYTLKSIQ